MKLKPCPFCGGEAKLVACEGEEEGWWMMFHECDFVTTCYFESIDEAIAAWNTREETAGFCQSKLKHEGGCIWTMD